MNNQIKETYDLLNNEILWICLRWKLFKQIYGSKENVELINEFAPVTFKFFQDSSFDMIILSINRLLDSPSTFGNDNLSLSRLILMIEDEEFDDLKEELQNLYDSIKKDCTNLKELRNIRIGHNDLESKKSNYELLSGVSRKKIDKILNNIYTFMNTISGHIYETEYHYDFVGSEGEDGKRLIKHLKTLKKLKQD